jgi:hypothetical protein
MPCPASGVRVTADVPSVVTLPNKKPRVAAGLLLEWRCASAPSRPAATSRLIVIREPRCSGRGSLITATVWFITNRPRLATFWRTSLGSGLQEHRPELAVVEQRLVELGPVLILGVVHGLQPSGSLQQKIGLEITRARGLP